MLLNENILEHSEKCSSNTEFINNLLHAYFIYVCLCACACSFSLCAIYDVKKQWRIGSEDPKTCEYDSQMSQSHTPCLLNMIPGY